MFCVCSLQVVRVCVRVCARTKCQYWIHRILRTIIWRLLKLCYSESVCGFCGLLWILFRWITVNFCTVLYIHSICLFDILDNNSNFPSLSFANRFYFEELWQRVKKIFSRKNCHLHQLLMESYVTPQYTPACGLNEETADFFSFSFLLSIILFLWFTLCLSSPCFLSIIIFCAFFFVFDFWAKCHSMIVELRKNDALCLYISMYFK